MAASPGQKLVSVVSWPQTLCTLTPGCPQARTPVSSVQSLRDALEACAATFQVSRRGHLFRETFLISLSKVRTFFSQNTYCSPLLYFPL